MATGQTPRDERHNMTDYEQARRDFKWEVAENYNFAHDAIGKWAQTSDKLAMLWVGQDGREERYTFADFDEQSSRVAHTFEKLGVKKGDRVLLMLPRMVEWWDTMLGLMKLGAVGIPCTTLLTPNDIAYRAEMAEAVAMVTDVSGIEKLNQVRAECPTIKTVVSVGEPGDACPDGCVNYHPTVDIANLTWYDRRTIASDPCLIYFTSGTVEYPKMVVHTHAEYPVVHTLATRYYWLDLQPEDANGNPWDLGWASFLDRYFEALPPSPYDVCLLSSAKSQTHGTPASFDAERPVSLIPEPDLDQE
jgi:acetyl-CoA synthetase/medium-chain acyl-CoA synthetase